MKPSRLQLALVTGALATTGLIWLAPNEGDLGVSESSKAGKVLRSPQDARTANQSPADSKSKAENLFAVLPSSAARPTLKDKASAGILAQSSWFIPPPPPPPSPPPPPTPPPPPPSAPPLPFIYLGKYLEGDVQLVILNQGGRVLTVAPGEVLDKNYRIERIEASNVVIKYLPLGISQTLSTGSSQ